MAANRVPYADRKEAIRAELKRLAAARETIFYSDLGQKLGIPARGPWKPILDEIASEERPDIT
jgi:hypothetical protein